LNKKSNKMLDGNVLLVRLDGAKAEFVYFFESSEFICQCLYEFLL